MVKATNENAKLILQQSSIEKEKKRNSSSSLPNVEEISSAVSLYLWFAGWKDCSILQTSYLWLQSCES